MSYKIYSGSFLAGHGYPLVIVTDPTLSGNIKASECHSFYSGKPESYMISTISYDSTESSSIDDDELIAAAKGDGENHIYDYLQENNEIQYQALIAGIISKIDEVEENVLIQLHLRNFLANEIEEMIIEKTRDSDLKSILQTIKRLNRITSAKKI
ncbi:hypothetical protein ACJJI5_10480 [Microbulbifer sp. EKSA008]|uniref:hypothetical protein n=1 Tax=unclassified Microbulbifer TaxID=2619833 RepID=UPI00403928D9